MLSMSCVFHFFSSVHCCLVDKLWSPAAKGLTSWVLFVMANCEVVTFPCGILGQVWYLIVLIPDLCHLSYFYEENCSLRLTHVQTHRSLD